LVLIERVGGQNIRQAKLAVRQLLAERDRVLREPVAMRLPPITPEKLAGVIRSLATTLEQGLVTTSETLPTAAPPAPTEPAHLAQLVRRSQHDEQGGWLTGPTHEQLWVEMFGSI